MLKLQLTLTLCLQLHTYTYTVLQKAVAAHLKRKQLTLFAIARIEIEAVSGLNPGRAGSLCILSLYSVANFSEAFAWSVPGSFRLRASFCRNITLMKSKSDVKQYSYT